MFNTRCYSSGPKETNTRRRWVCSSRCYNQGSQSPAQCVTSKNYTFYSVIYHFPNIWFQRKTVISMLPEKTLLNMWMWCAELQHSMFGRINYSSFNCSRHAGYSFCVHIWKIAQHGRPKLTVHFNCDRAASLSQRRRKKKHLLIYRQRCETTA